MKTKNFMYKIDQEAMDNIRSLCYVHNIDLQKFVSDVEKAKKLSAKYTVSVPDRELVQVVHCVYIGFLPSVEHWMKSMKEESDGNFKFYQHERGNVEGKYATIEPVVVKKRKKK